MAPNGHEMNSKSLAHENNQKMNFKCTFKEFVFAEVALDCPLEQNGSIVLSGA